MMTMLHNLNWEVKQCSTNLEERQVQGQGEQLRANYRKILVVVTQLLISQLLMEAAALHLSLAVARLHDCLLLSFEPDQSRWISELGDGGSFMIVYY